MEQNPQYNPITSYNPICLMVKFHGTCWSQSPWDPPASTGRRFAGPTVRPRSEPTATFFWLIAHISHSVTCWSIAYPPSHVWRSQNYHPIITCFFKHILKRFYWRKSGCWYCSWKICSWFTSGNPWNLWKNMFCFFFFSWEGHWGHLNLPENVAHYNIWY